MERLDPIIDNELCYKILLLCARGRSNYYICEKLGINLFNVVHALEYVVNFYGFKRDLDIDTYELYKRQPIIMGFLEEAHRISKVNTELEFVIAFMINKKFTEIERTLKENGFTP